MGGVVNPIISLNKVTYFFLNCVIAGQFLGDIFVNAISYKRSLLVIFHDFFLLGDNFFLKICFLGKRCFRQKKKYFDDKPNWMGAKKNCIQVSKRKGGGGGITCVETLEAGKVPCIQGTFYWYGNSLTEFALGVID